MRIIAFLAVLAIAKTLEAETSQTTTPPPAGLHPTVPNATAPGRSFSENLDDEEAGADSNLRFVRHVIQAGVYTTILGMELARDRALAAGSEIRVLKEEDIENIKLAPCKEGKVYVGVIKVNPQQEKNLPGLYDASSPTPNVYCANLALLNKAIVGLSSEITQQASDHLLQVYSPLKVNQKGSSGFTLKEGRHLRVPENYASYPGEDVPATIEGIKNPGVFYHGTVKKGELLAAAEVPAPPEVAPAESPVEMDEDIRAMAPVMREVEKCAFQKHRNVDARGQCYRGVKDTFDCAKYNKKSVSQALLGSNWGTILSQGSAIDAKALLEKKGWRNLALENKYKKTTDFPLGTVLVFKSCHPSSASNCTIDLEDGKSDPRKGWGPYHGHITMRTTDDPNNPDKPKFVSDFREKPYGVMSSVPSNAETVLKRHKIVIPPSKVFPVGSFEGYNLRTDSGLQKRCYQLVGAYFPPRSALERLKP